MGKIGKGVDMAELFGDTPREYEIIRAHRVYGCGTPLISADVRVPLFGGDGAEGVNEFYREMADAFFAWLSDGGSKAAMAVFESDPDPRRRFRFRRFCVTLDLLPGFSSGGFVSVGGSLTVRRGGVCRGAWVGAQQWRMRDCRLLPFSPRGGKTAAFFTRDGRFAVLEASPDGVLERDFEIDKTLTEFKMISKLFATIR